MCIRLSGSVARNTATDMPAPVHSNLSYVITPSHSTIRSSRALPTAGAATAMNHDQAQCPDYSCLGPDYEIVDSSGQSQGKHAAQATSQSRRLSQRYEYSEVHLAADGGATASTHYEVPLNLRQNETKENEDYSHLKH